MRCVLRMNILKQSGYAEMLHWCLAHLKHGDWKATGNGPFKEIWISGDEDAVMFKLRFSRHEL